MSKTKAIARKIIVLLIGLPILVIGIILIPLPGPGLLVCFLALFILSTEFDWANKYFEKVKFTVKQLIQKARDDYQKAKEKSK